MPRIEPIDAPMEFELPDGGNAEPAQLLLQQAAAGEIPLSVAETLAMGGMAVMKAEAAKNALQAKPCRCRNAYLYSVQHA